MSEERDEIVELGIGGKYFRIIARSLLPIVLVLGLIATGAVLLRHIITIHDDMAQLESAVIYKVNTEAHFRQAEHGDLLTKLDKLFADQTQMLMNELSNAQLTAGKSHGSIERAITRSCRAKDKDFAKVLQPYVSYSPEVIY